MNALAAMSRAEPGSAGAVKAVSVISTGTVRIHPEHLYRTHRPLYWWLLTSRRWTPPRPVNVYAIEHANGLILFGTGQGRASVSDGSYYPGGFTGCQYHRLARFDIGADDTLTAQLAALGYPSRRGPARSSHCNTGSRAWSCCPPTTRRPHSGYWTADTQIRGGHVCIPCDARRC